MTEDRPECWAVVKAADGKLIVEWAPFAAFDMILTQHESREAANAAKAKIEEEERAPREADARKQTTLFSEEDW